MKITFFGAAQEVTGSRYLVASGSTQILVDCGLFQGSKEIAMRNFDPFPVDPRRIDAIVLTHAHIDHTGYIPALVKKGFSGAIYCSHATYALCRILLVDSGFLQEEYTRKANRYQDPRAPKKEPLYTVADAEHALQFFKTVDFNTDMRIGNVQARLVPVGHILGASAVVVSDGTRVLTFSGDVGRPNQLLMKAPERVARTDYLVLESTYGDRIHPEDNAMHALTEVAQETFEKGGVLVIPVFAVGRSQMLLYCLHQLKQQGVIPDIPIFLDSPMAIRVTDLFCRFSDEHKLSPTQCKKVFAGAIDTPTTEESRKINKVRPPYIILAGSGMADGGRAFDHFKNTITDKRNTILFVGYQGQGTTGRVLVEGAEKITIYGKSYPVCARIKTIDSFSAHADYKELLSWLRDLDSAPKKVFLTHGELESAEALKKKLEDLFGWSVVIPKYSASFDLN